MHEPSTAPRQWLLRLLLLGAPLCACNSRAEAPPSGAGAASSIAHWDPTTRTFTPPSPAVAQRLIAVPTHPTTPLREETAPRGGTMVRLGDHFRHHVSAAAMDDGRVQSSCATEPQLTAGP